MRSLVFVSESESKLMEIRAVLGNVGHQRASLTEIQSVDVQDVVAAKATEARQAFPNSPVLIDDTSLAITAWNGLPGALIKWFITRVGPSGIVTMMQSTEDRRATATTVVAVHDGSLSLFSGSVEGTIASECRGSNGFGWDSIFVPSGSELTFAEMTTDEKEHYSMRAIALNKLRNSESTRGLEQESK